MCSRFSQFYHRSKSIVDIKVQNNDNSQKNSKFRKENATAKATAHAFKGRNQCEKQKQE